MRQNKFQNRSRCECFIFYDLNKYFYCFFTCQLFVLQNYGGFVAAAAMSDLTRIFRCGLAVEPITNMKYGGEFSTIIKIIRKVSLYYHKIEVFTNSLQYKNANIANFILAVPFRMSLTNEICNLNM